MRNCLVTKLKGTVDNDNLPKFGKIVVGSTMTGTEHWYMRFKEATTIGCLNGTFAGGVREKTFTAGSICYSGNEITMDDPNEVIAEMEIPKYQGPWFYNRIINGLSSAKGRILDASFLEYFDGPADICFAGITGNNAIVKNFKPEYFSHFAFGSSDSQNTAVRLTACTFETLDITNLYLYVPSTTNSIDFSHSIGIVGNLDGLGTLADHVTSIVPPNTKTTSVDLANFIRNARGAGINTGSVNIKYPYSTTVKVNGVEINPDQTPNGILEWTADSATFQGNPITV